MILSSVTSSPEESLASNLQRDTVLLSSLSAGSKPMAPGQMRSHWKKLCSAERAAEVIGPVESGERMIAKKGARSDVSDIERKSVRYVRHCHGGTQNLRTFHVLHRPSQLLEAAHEFQLAAPSVRHVRRRILACAPEPQAACQLGITAAE